MTTAGTPSPNRITNPRQILCAIDLSDVSPPALACAVSLGRAFGAKVTVLHVFDPSSLLTPLDGLPNLQAMLAPFATAGEMPRLVTAEGNATAEIVRHARDLNADLIVLGTHGRSGFDRFALGSVAEKVLRKAPCPVLTVPPGAGSAAQAVAFRRILCPVDFSGDAAQALAFGVALADRVDGSVTALHVVESLDGEPGPLTPDYIAEFRRQQRQGAQTSLQALIAAQAPAARVTGVVGLGRPHREILRVASEQASDLIVIGVRGRGPVDLTLFGSTTQQVVRRATCPVLTIRS